MDLRKNYLTGANRFLSEDEGMNTEEILDTAKLAINKLMESNEFISFVKDFVQKEQQLDENTADEVTNAITEEIWPRLAAELPKLI